MSNQKYTINVSFDTHFQIQYPKVLKEIYLSWQILFKSKYQMKISFLVEHIFATNNKLLELLSITYKRKILSI